MDRLVHTTLSLPTELLEATDRAVQQKHARSRNEFVAIALRHSSAEKGRN